MTNELRSTLHRLADDVRPVPVADDLWQRARAANRRGQNLALGLALALVLCVGGIAALALGGDKEAHVANSEVPGGAIPSRIEDLPSEMTVRGPDGSFEHPLQRAGEVGQSSVAFINDGVPVLVSATDGGYHTVELPGWAAESIALALSPDGRRLAWQSHSSVDTTVSIVELDTGRVDNLTVSDAAELSLRDLAWSPDGSWLAWIGDGDAAGPLVGSWQVARSTAPQALGFDGTVTDVAVSNEGELLIGSENGELTNVDATGRRSIQVPRELGAGLFSPSGKQVALRSGPSGASYTLGLERERVLTHPFPDDTFDQMVVRPVGWIDDRLQLLVVQQFSDHDAELVVTTPTVNETSTWRRSVGVIASESVPSLTVAVDLIPDLDGTSSQQLTHDFGQTLGDRSPGADRLPYVLGGLLALLAGLAYIRMLGKQA